MEDKLGNLVGNERLGYPYDWNAQFQKLLQLPETTEEQKLEKYEQLSSLNKVSPLTKHIKRASVHN